MYRVFGDIMSGNCYKVKLLLGYLNLEHTWQHVDILKGESRTPEFLQRNPNGKIPVLEFEPGCYLWESNAILNYLADGTPFMPDNALERARVIQWQSFEQYSHEPYIAVARYISKYLGLPEERREEYESKQAGGKAALAIMERHLGHTAFFVGDRPTTADISLYAYTHVADEGGFDLQDCPSISRWLQALERQSGYVSMQAR